MTNKHDDNNQTRMSKIVKTKINIGKTNFIFPVFSITFFINDREKCFFSEKLHLTYQN